MLNILGSHNDNVWLCYQFALKRSLTHTQCQYEYNPPSQSNRNEMLTIGPKSQNIFPVQRKKMTKKKRSFQTGFLTTKILSIFDLLFYRNLIQANMNISQGIGTDNSTVRLETNNSFAENLSTTESGLDGDKLPEDYSTRTQSSSVKFEQVSNYLR